MNSIAVGEQIGTSRLRLGVTHVDQSLLYGNAEAEGRARAALAAMLSCQATHIHSYGLSDVWSAPGGEPDNWYSFDLQLASMQTIGAPIAVTLYNLPWWMKGVCNGDGSTTPLTVGQQFSDNGRLLTDQQDAWRLLVRRVVERVLPLGVRHFKIGQEGKGYYTARDGTPRRWDFDDYPGTPGLADMGFTHFYKITAAVVMAVAGEMGVGDVELSGPYPRLAFQGEVTAACVPEGHPLRTCPGGMPQRAPIEAAETFLDLVQAQGIPLHRFTYDMGCRNKDGVIVEPDDFANLARYAAVAAYWRAQLESRGLAIPIDLAEWYAKPQLDPGPNSMPLRTALKAEALRLFAEAGLADCYAWSPFGLGDEPGVTTDGAWIAPTVAGGGNPTPLGEALALFTGYFGPGTPLHAVAGTGDALSALASDRHVLLINKTDGVQAAIVDRLPVELAPYAVRIMERPMAETLLTVGDVVVELAGDGAVKHVLATNNGASQWRVQVNQSDTALFDETLEAYSSLGCDLASGVSVQVGPVV